MSDFGQNNQQTFFKHFQSVQRQYNALREERPENQMKVPLTTLDEIFETKYEPGIEA